MSYLRTNPFDDSTPIEIRVCNTCSNATIRAVGSWGATDERPNYNGEFCTANDRPALFLAKPPVPEVAVADEYTINVFANGTLISTRPFPTQDDINANF